MDRTALARLIEEQRHMARYKAYDLNQAKMIPLSYADQVARVSTFVTA